MITKYTTQYKTFESLMADIEDDLTSFSNETYVYSDKYIKIVQTCNSKLSTKINPIKEDVITVTNKKGKLPKDFKVLEQVYACAPTTIIQSTLNFNKEVCPAYTFSEVRNCCNNIAYIEDPRKLFSFVVYKQEIKSLVNVTRLFPVSIINSLKFCSANCPTRATTNIQIQIERQGDDFYILSDYDGEFYISYVSEMVDDEGNLLILDHPLVIPYYEYAIKERIFEDVWLNDLLQVQNKLSYLKESLRTAQMDALRFVRTSDFAELKQVYFDNRKRFKMKYNDIIQE